MLNWSTLRLAILADIHANLHALEAVLDDISGQAVDHIIVNGDMVNRGPNNIQVMERVWDKGYTLILGNHDDLMRKWIDRDDDLPTDWFESDFWEGTAWCARQLEGEGWIDKLRRLPMTYRPDIKHAPSLLISHGSPRHYREGYSEYLPDNMLSEILQMHPADVLVGSHTHQPMERRWGQNIIYNTGAVGTPFNRDVRAQYLILELKDKTWQAEFRAVDYDRQAAQQAFIDSNYLAEGGLSAELFYLELIHARSFLTPFWMWAEKKGLDHNRSSWQQFQKASPERFEGVELI